MPVIEVTVWLTRRIEHITWMHCHSSWWLCQLYLCSTWWPAIHQFDHWTMLLSLLSCHATLPSPDKSSACLVFWGSWLEEMSCIDKSNLGLWFIKCLWNNNRKANGSTQGAPELCRGKNAVNASAEWWHRVHVLLVCFWYTLLKM